MGRQRVIRGTITCTEGREPSGLAMESLSRVLGDVYRYPIEMQNDVLFDAIASFRSAQELGLAYVHNFLGLPVPRSNREWMEYWYTVPPDAAGVARADGVKIDIHGAGIEIVHPEFTIDYDYGPNGECDCFDAWRLALHRHRSRRLPWPVEGQLELRALLDSAASCGTIVALPDSPYFIHPAFRSDWNANAIPDNPAMHT